jgi:hypothetical protein
VLFRSEPGLLHELSHVANGLPHAHAQCIRKVRIGISINNKHTVLFSRVLYKMSYEHRGHGCLAGAALAGYRYYFPQGLAFLISFL